MKGRIIFRLEGFITRELKQHSAIFLIILMVAAFFSVITVSADEFTTTLVYVSPSSQIVSPSQSFSINIYCSPGQPIKSYEFKISFNASLLQANSVTEGNIFSGYTTFFSSGTINNTTGTIINIYGLILGSGNVTAPGSLAVVNFTSKTISGTSSLSVYDVGVTNETAYVPVSVTNGSVQVDATAPVIVNYSPSSGYTGDTYTFNISATDNVDSANSLTVKVNYTHGSSSGNITMTNTGGNYFEKSITLNLYSTSSLTYKFYAQDTHGNINSTTTYSATVYDNDAPDINNTTSTPSTQEVGGYINLTAAVTDNIGVNKVYLNVTYPNSSSENISITTYAGSTYYNNRTYSVLGTYNYFFWANDSRNNARTSSTKTFIIGDSTAPVISSVNRTNSSILDTDPVFGWVNITSTVSDNVGVNQVYLNLTYPNTTTAHLSMSRVQATSTYYYNTSLSVYGNYSYVIWANDTSNNQVLSSSYNISMPPNWDINCDGNQNVFDFVLVSNHYGELGSMGWTREDVDNNGMIQVLDLVLMSNHYGETWWA